MSTENEQPVTNADWEAWKAEHGDDLKRIDELVARGHTRHCACRQVWGDGECSCELEKERERANFEGRYRRTSKRDY